MRMGKAGFVRSTFLQKVNEGDLTGAGKWLLLQKADGSVYPTGNEPKQYFYVLQLLWYGDLAIGELLDFPMFSYKGIDVGSVYTIDGEYVYTPEIGDRLNAGKLSDPERGAGTLVASKLKRKALPLCAEGLFVCDAEPIWTKNFFMIKIKNVSNGEANA